MLRLRTATVPELAAHSGVKQTTVKGFLHDHLGSAVVVNGAASLPGRTRGRPATIWRLTAIGEEAFFDDLRRVTGVSPEIFATERNESEIAVRHSLAVLITAVSDHEQRDGVDNSEDVSAAHGHFARRAEILQIAVNDLLASGCDMRIEEAALAHVKAYVNALAPSSTGDETPQPPASIAFSGLDPKERSDRISDLVVDLHVAGDPYMAIDATMLERFPPVLRTSLREVRSLEALGYGIVDAGVTSEMVTSENLGQLEHVMHGFSALADRLAVVVSASEIPVSVVAEIRSVAGSTLMGPVRPGEGSREDSVVSRPALTVQGG